MIRKSKKTEAYAALQEFLQTEGGALFWAEFSDFCRAFSGLGNDPNDIVLNEGKRLAWLFIFDNLAAATPAMRSLKDMIDSKEKKEMARHWPSLTQGDINDE